MSPDQIERFLAAADAAVSKTVGEPNLETASEKGHRIFKFFADHLEKVRTREQIKEALARVEISFAEEKLLLGTLRYAPNLLRLAFSHVADLAKKELPPAPGGRPLAIETRSEQQKVCEFVGHLFSHGVELELAYKRAAQRYGVSAHTVSRLWQKRAAIAAGETELSYSEVAQEAAKLLDG